MRTSADWQYTPLTVLFLLTGLLCGYVAYVAWRRRAVPGAVPFAVLMTGIAGWTLFDAVEKAAANYQLRYFFSTLTYLFLVLTPNAWFAFAVRFSRRDRWLTPRLVALLFIHPIVVTTLALTDHWHGLLRAHTEIIPTADGVGMRIEYGSLFWFHTAYTYTLFAAGAVFLLAGTARRPDMTWTRRAAILTAMLVPTLGNVAYVFRWQPLLEHGDLTPVYFALTGLIAFWTVFQVRLFDVLPLAREFVLDCLTDPVFVLDKKRRLLDANAAARALLPAVPAPWRNQPLSRVFPELWRLLPSDLPEDGFAIEIQLPALDPRRSWDMHVRPMLDGGVTVGTLVRLTDVTERKREERERRALDEKLRQVQKAQSLAVLAGGVAHDFNNLLTVIIGNTEQAQANLGGRSATAAVLQSVLEAANRAGNLTRQMLTYAGRAYFLPQPVSLSALIESMADLLRAAVHAPAVLEFDLAPDLPPLAGDPDQLRQVLLALVTNAVEALGDQPGTVCVRTRRAEVRAEDLTAATTNEGLTPGVHLLLEVSDTGAGMDAPTVARIFDPFFTTKFTGRGLGLAVVLGVVRIHGGAIFVASEREVGTQFRLVLPFAPALTPPAVRPPHEPRRVPASAHTTGTILLVDDEQSVRDVARRFLEDAGFRVLPAAGGAEALQLYRERAADIDVVLLDLTMPEMGGGEVLTLLREHNPEAAVIVMSGYDEQTALGRLRGHVPSAFLLKPFRGGDLTTTIRSVLGRTQRVRP